MASSRRTATNENISTYGNITRDYTVLATWEAATDIDLVSATQSEVLECYDDEVSFDDYVQLLGATTNSSYFRIICPASGEGHDGTPNNGFTFISTTDSYLLRIDEAYSQIHDLIGKLNINSANDRHTFGAHSNQSAVVACIIFDSNNSGAGVTQGVLLGLNIGIGETAFAINCLSHNCETWNFQQAAAAVASCIFHNCTSTNGITYGFYNADASLAAIAKNCCSSGNSTADWGDAGGGWTKTTCTVEGANPIYKNAGGDDFHLAATDTVCRGNGTDLSSDGSYAFDDDIDEETRSAWDIGFDEYSWRGKINSVTNPAKINGIDVANIAKVNGVS